MISPKQIEEKTMSPDKRAEAKNSFFGFYVGRPISYVLTVPFLYTNISPNMVTIISILLAIAGYFILSFGDDVELRLLGLLMFFLWNMGDGIDGNIARYKDLKSANGDLLDTLGGYIALSLILLSMGNAAFMDSEGHVFFSRLVPIVLAGIGTSAALIPRLLMHRKIANEKGNSKIEFLTDSAIEKEWRSKRPHRKFRYFF